VTSVYRQPDPPLTCVWGCGRKDFNVEHIIGQQYAKALNLSLPMTAHWGDHTETMTKELAILVPDRVCRGCNNGWMRKLDNRVISFMRRALTEGAHISLDTPFKQTQLAFWATKVALLLLVFQHDLTVKHQLEDMGPFTIPYADLEYVWQRKRPSDRTRVWVGARHDVGDIPFLHHESAVFSLTTDEARATVRMENGSLVRDTGFRILFALGRLVFAVWGWQLDYDAGTPHGIEDPNELVPDSMLPIWPGDERKPVEWPPPHQLSAQEIGRICHTEPEWVQ